MISACFLVPKTMWWFSAPQTHFWLIKVWFSALAFVVKIPTIKIKMNFEVINLEDFDEEIYFSYANRCAELYHKYKEIKMNTK